MKRKEILVILLISVILTLIAGCAGPTVKFGSIDVNSTPTGARVYINGVDTGMVTPIVFTKEVGDYTVKLDLSLYKIWEGIVTVNAEQTTYINAPLIPAIVATITMQPDDAAGKDAVVVVSGTPFADIPYGDLSGLAFGKYISGGSAYYYRSYLQFDLSTVPGNSRVVYANLSLYQYFSRGTASSNTIVLYQVTGDWEESTITWNNQSISSIVAESSCTVYAGSTTWKSWYNIGNLVQSWLDGTITNQGMLLKATDETSIDLEVDCYSSDYTTDTSKHPKLTINYYIP
jgi:hypothetical protein